MSLAPIVLFVYNRPQHTLRTLEALSQNVLAKDSELYIFADGPKDNVDDETLKRIKEVRAIVKSKEWCRKTILTEGNINKGLANSIIDGVSKIVKEYGKIIVLEDDLLTSPYFLKYMNDALAAYESNDEVACISGYIYPVKQKMPETFFFKGADCWGWATWDRAWNVFETDGTKLLNELNKQSLNREFDFNNTYPYTLMLKEQITGKNNSWAIRWYASAFLKDMFCLYPGISLVQNIGIDGSGTHSGISDKWDILLSDKQIVISAIPVQEHKAAKEQVSAYFKSLQLSRLSSIKAYILKTLSVLKK